jgi:hypothetical protein
MAKFEHYTLKRIGGGLMMLTLNGQPVAAEQEDGLIWADYSSRPVSASELWYDVMDDACWLWNSVLADDAISFLEKASIYDEICRRLDAYHEFCFGEGLSEGDLQEIVPDLEYEDDDED